MPATHKNAGEKKPPRQQLINALGWQIETKVIMHNIQIDNEFKSLIPPLSAEERAQLEETGLGTQAAMLAAKVERKHSEFQALSASEQMLFIVAYITVIKGRAKKAKAIAAKWIKSARANFKPGPKQPCVVCGQFQSVAHAHHLTPLHIQAHRSSFDQEFVWLCPTHHSGVHLCLDGRHTGIPPDLLGFSDADQVAMARIAAMGD